MLPGINIEGFFKKFPMKGSFIGSYPTTYGLEANFEATAFQYLRYLS